MRFRIYLILLITFNVGLFGQGGTNYTYNGIGEVENFHNAQFAGMAGTSIAMPMYNGININNPAMWTYNEYTKMQIGYKFNQNLIANNELEIAQFNGKLDGLQMIMVLDTSSGFTLGMGLYSYSNVNFSVSKPISYSLDDEFSVSGKHNKLGEGGVSTAYVGMSYEVIDNLSLGLSANLNFGRILSSSESLFEDDRAFDQYAIFDDAVLGSFYKVGLAYEYENFIVGGFYETKSNTTISNETVYLKSNKIAMEPIMDTTEIVIPSKYGFGLSYNTKNYIIGFDYISQDFTEMQYKKGTDVSFGDNMSISLGGIRKGSRSYNSNFINKISYMAGLGYNKYYFNVLDNDITEFFGSFGMSIPLSDNTLFDVSVVLGSRGSKDNGLIQEQFAKFNFNISIGETWFKPYKFEYEE